MEERLWPQESASTEKSIGTTYKEMAHCGKGPAPRGRRRRQGGEKERRASHPPEKSPPERRMPSLARKGGKRTHFTNTKKGYQFFE